MCLYVWSWPVPFPHHFRIISHSSPRGRHIGVKDIFFGQTLAFWASFPAPCTGDDGSIWELMSVTLYDIVWHCTVKNVLTFLAYYDLIHMMHLMHRLNSTQKWPIFLGRHPNHSILFQRNSNIRTRWTRSFLFVCRLSLDDSLTSGPSGFLPYLLVERWNMVKQSWISPSSQQYHKNGWDPFAPFEVFSYLAQLPSWPRGCGQKVNVHDFPWTSMNCNGICSTSNPHMCCIFLDTLYSFICRGGFLRVVIVCLSTSRSWALSFNVSAGLSKSQVTPWGKANQTRSRADESPMARH